MSLKFVLICIIVLWLLNKIYKVIFPVLHMTSSATKHMREMQEQMKKMEQNMAEKEARQKQRKRSKIDGDYIDYEELK